MANQPGTGKQVNPVIAAIVILVVVGAIIALAVTQLGGGYNKVTNAAGTDQIKSQVMRTGRMPGTMLPGMIPGQRRP